MREETEIRKVGFYSATRSAETQTAGLQSVDEDNTPLQIGRRPLCHVVCLPVPPRLAGALETNL